MQSYTERQLQHIFIHLARPEGCFPMLVGTQQARPFLSAHVRLCPRSKQLSRFKHSFQQVCTEARIALPSGPPSQELNSHWEQLLWTSFRLSQLKVLKLTENLPHSALVCLQLSISWHAPLQNPRGTVFSRHRLLGMASSTSNYTIWVNTYIFINYINSIGLKYIFITLASLWLQSSILLFLRSMEVLLFLQSMSTLAVWVGLIIFPLRC